MLNATWALSVLTITMTTTMTTAEYILKLMDEKAKDALLLQCLADNKFDVAKDLLDHIDIPYTLLSSQIKLEAIAAVEFLILNNVPWIADECGRTPLHLAVSRNMHGTVKLLLHSYRLVNDVSNAGNNALSFGLIESGRKLDTNIIRTLLNGGIDLHRKNMGGRSALDILRDWFSPTDLPFIPEMIDPKQVAELQTKLSNETTNRIAIQQQLTEAQAALSATQTELSAEKEKNAALEDKLDRVKKHLKSMPRF